jgi:hypothetical protein
VKEEIVFIELKFFLGPFECLFYQVDVFGLHGFLNDSVNRNKNKRVLTKAQRTTESASDANENMLGLELTIFHECIPAKGRRKFT